MTSTDPTAAFRLDDKVALITGASSGLGARFARVASAAGATVVVAARRAERLAELVDELDDAHAVEVDLTAPGGQKRASPDRSNSPAVSMSSSTTPGSRRWRRHSTSAPRTSVTRSRSTSSRPLPLPARSPDAITNDRSASIINIGSILGEVGGGKLRVPGYAAAKGGLHNLTRELASQWGRKGVRVNAIAPGWFETEMNDAMFSDGGGQAYMESGAAMGRPGIEGELDGAMLYLASDASSFVTGHVLQVSGGWTAT